MFIRFQGLINSKKFDRYYSSINIGLTVDQLNSVKAVENIHKLREEKTPPVIV
jgi:hypothetical protein